jgi:hypothetical protein
MDGFTKLFSGIIHSSIWCEDNDTRIVWITLLAMCGPDGTVEASIPGLASAAKISLDKCEKALEKLKEPDKYSRSSEFEGRRIEKIEGGFLILNYQKYRAKRDPLKRKEQNRIAQETYRSKQKVSQNKPQVSRDNPKKAQAEAEAEEKEKEKENCECLRSRQLPTVEQFKQKL